MLDIKKDLQGTELTLVLSGRLDTSTAPDLDQIVTNDLSGITLLVFDIKGLEYLSSAGLRALLRAQKLMNDQGRMVIRHACDTIMEVFQVTGFDSFLNIE